MKRCTFPLSCAGGILKYYLVGVVVALMALCGVVHAEERPQSPPLWSLEKCLHMVNLDPYGARDYALGWQGKVVGWQTQFCHAFALRQQGDAQKAATMFTQVAAISSAGEQEPPKSVKVTSLRDASEIWYLLGDIPRARVCASQGLSLDNKDVGLCIVSTRILLKQGQPQQARQHLTSCQNNAAQTAEGEILLARIDSLLGNDKHALDRLNKVISEVGDNSQALLLRGQVYMQLKDFASARHDWQDIIDIYPQTHEADMASQNLILMDSNPDIP